jgi:hypothetical protein
MAQPINQSILLRPVKRKEMVMLKKTILAAIAALAMSPVSAAVLDFTSVLSGSNENPSVATAAQGLGSLRVDTVAKTLDVALLVSGIKIDSSLALPGESSLSDDFKNVIAGGALGPIHLHQGGAGQNGGILVAFPFGATYQHAANGFLLTVEDLDISDVFDTFITEANAGRVYFNVHTNENPGGEIRGQLDAVAPVPLPASAVLLIAGVGGLAAMRRKRA